MTLVYVAHKVVCSDRTNINYEGFFLRMIHWKMSLDERKYKCCHKILLMIVTHCKRQEYVSINPTWCTNANVEETAFKA